MQLNIGGSADCGISDGPAHNVDAIIVPAGRYDVQSTRALRSLPGGALLRLVALTGYGREQDKARRAQPGLMPSSPSPRTSRRCSTRCTGCQQLATRDSPGLPPARQFPFAVISYYSWDGELCSFDKRGARDCEGPCQSGLAGLVSALLQRRA